jgi:hypothetical protein
MINNSQSPWALPKNGARRKDALGLLEPPEHSSEHEFGAILERR